MPAGVAGNSRVRSARTLAVSCRTPSVAYAVGWVPLGLARYATTAGDVAAIGCYTDSGGIPGPLLTSLLNTRRRAQRRPPAASRSARTPPIGPRWPGRRGIFGGACAAGTPPGGLATLGRFKPRTGDGDWSNWSTSKLSASGATAVPEPEQCAAATAAGRLGFGPWRRVRQA